LTVPLNNERESGFLFPHVGYSERRGFDLGVPYYLNLAPNYDATLEPRVMTKRGGMLGGQFRYLDERSKGEIDFNYVPHDDEADRERNYVRIAETTSFSPNWGLGISINHISDPNYLHDYGESLISTSTSLLQSSAYLNGHGGWWSASIGG